MLRRAKAGGSPFKADRQHLHHWLLDQGMAVWQANLLMFLASLACALIGVAGWKFAVPEPLLFAAFVALFLIYHVGMSRYFRVRDVMTTAMGALPEKAVAQQR
jgi:UDP-GlcNAc:undecaprenyl-phosphate GlcNAc-1-phosphate transferase